MVLLLPSMSPPQAIGAAQLAPIPSTATTGTTPPQGVSLVASSSSAVTNGAVMASPAPHTPPLSQPLTLSSPSSSASASASTIPTPGAPLLPHASLPQQPPAHSSTLPFFPYPQPQANSPPHTPLPNPFPFPTWYPESAHFVRQWWPTLPGVPRVSCTVVLLAMHDQETHRNRFVLAQHYFKVPIDWSMWVRGEGITPDSGAGSTTGSGTTNVMGDGISNTGAGPALEEREGDDELMKMWYVSRPFEVVRVFDDRDDEDNQMLERPRPLVVVDFRHAVWIAYDDNTAAQLFPAFQQ